MKRTGTGVLLFVVAFAAGIVVPARSCGPELPEAAFVSRRAPDDPRLFGSGQIGIPLPSYYQRYLYLAYRALSGHALEGAELDAALRLPSTSYGEDQPGYARWRAVRDSLGGERNKDYVSLACAHQRGDVYYYYPNYYDDAFRSATETLLDRTRRQGSADAFVRDWMTGQDAVFHACGYDSSPAPPAVPAGSPSWLVKDRVYQTASWNFYSGRFDEAAAGFRAVADDHASPWRDWGAYLVARAYTRKGTVTPDRLSPNREALLQAEKQLEAVLADKSLSARYDSARRLLDFVRLNLDPAKRLAQVSHALLEVRPTGDVTQQVFDLTSLLDRFTQAQAESLAKTSPDFELADWILSFQSNNEPHALDRWRATGSAAWLVAAMSAAQKPTPEVLTAAAQIPVDHPAFWCVQFHRARLLAADGREDDARRLLDERPMQLDASGTNALRALRMQLAKDFDEFQRYGARSPVSMSGYYAGGQTPVPNGDLLDQDAAYVLNRWAPVSVVARASQRNEPTLRDPILIAAWTRAVILDSDSTSTRLSEALATAVPALATDLHAFATAPDPASRRFEATWLMLHTPGMTPWVRWGVGRAESVTERDMFRDNWWPVESKSQGAWFLGGQNLPMSEPESWTNPSGWDSKLCQRILTADQRARAERELAAITKAGPGANYLCQQTIAWAKSHPSDSRLPEALGLCVEATRYGYMDQTTTQWSRQAFSLLHSRYPGDPWAKKTKYWY